MPTTDLQVSPKRAAVAAVVFSNILWGSSFLFGKWALEEWPSSYVVLGRFAIAAALLAPALRRGRLEKGDLKWVLLGGFLMAPVMMGLQFEGLDRTTATSAALIIGTIPVLLTIAGILFEGERPGWKTWAAILASTAGAALLVGTPGEGRGLVGDVLVFASAVAAVAWIMVVRQLMRRHDALYVTALNIIIGGAMMIPIAWALDGSPVGIVANTTQPLTWWAMAGLGVLCTGLTYSLWNWGQRQLPASIAGAFVNMEPLAGAILGITILGEAASPLLLAGGALILVGAFAASIVGGK